MRPLDAFISERSLSVDASGIRKVFDLAAKLKDPINLSIGQPDFAVPELARQHACDAINGGANSYTQTQGIAQLRDELFARLKAEIGKPVDDLLITSGVSGGLLLTILATINPGDEVIFLDPYFVMYKHLVSLAGGVSKPVSSYPDFRFPADKVEAAITERTKLIIICSPSNPTGTLLNAGDKQAAVDIAGKHGLLLLSDEIYHAFTYENFTPSPMAEYDRCIMLRGFSKSHAMTGWRLGYAAGPKTIIEEMTKLQQYTFVCAPSPLQVAAVAALDIDMSEQIDAYRRKRDMAYEMLRGSFEVVEPGGAFYIFPKVPRGLTGTEFVQHAIDNNVLIIPGNVFSDVDTHFRISYATTDDKLQAGCEILCKLANAAVSPATNT